MVLNRINVSRVLAFVFLLFDCRFCSLKCGGVLGNTKIQGFFCKRNKELYITEAHSCTKR
jgi:hypothetical protein